jgi:nucleotide-binding universal stress UspA family protein
MKILLAVDGSKHSLKAAKYLVRHASAYRTRPEVQLLYVHRPLPDLPNMRLVVGGAQIRQYYQETGTAALSRAKKLLSGARIRHVARVLVGDAAYVIAREAVRTGCDLIVIGSRGMTAAANLVLGSTATKVLHVASLPVMLVK